MLTFSKPISAAGSNAVRINVSRNGAPFGQIWTFKDTKTERHPWHGKTLSGEYFVTYPGTGPNAKKIAAVDAMLKMQEMAR